MKIFNFFTANKLNIKKIGLKKNELEAINITNTSLMASQGVAEGKNFPVLFIDTKKREDIKDMIENHQCVSMGEVTTTFCEYKKDKSNLLILFQMKEPNICNFFIEFNLIYLGHVLDLLIKNQGCYIQSDFYGKRCSESMDAPKILVEIPNQHIIQKWRKQYRINIIEKYMKDGFKRKEAIEYAENFINESDNIFNFRLK